jgi:hypothetical protein
MNPTRRTTLAMLAASSVVGVWPRLVDAADAALPAEEEIRRLLIRRIDEEHQSVGMLIGLVLDVPRLVRTR